MIQIEQRLSGLWAWIERNPKRARAPQVKRVVKAALVETLKDWAADRLHGSYGLSERFRPRAFGTLNLERRQGGYQSWQKRVLGGRVLPYRSPKRKVHMAELVTVPNHGHKVSGRAGQDGVVRARLTLPGARVLNLVAPIYRKQFLGFGTNDTRSPAVIQRVSQQRIMRRLTALIADTPTKRKKPRRRAAP